MVLGPIFFILLVLLVGKLQVAFEFDSSGSKVYFRYLFIKKKISSKKKKKESESKEKKKEEKGGGGPGFRKIIRGLKAGPEFVPAVRKFFRSFVHYGEIPELKVHGELGTGDPYYTGIGYGLFQTIGGVIKAAVPQFEFKLIPDFTREVYDFKLGGKGQIRVGSLLYVFLITLVYLPKRQTWRLIRER